MSPVISNLVKGELSLNIIFRDCADEDGGGFIAECLEIPGCIAQGDTFAEAESGIRDSIQGCLSVMFEDCIAKASSDTPRNVVGISRQERLSVMPPQLQAVGA